jgi:O-antigen ligase
MHVGIFIKQLLPLSIYLSGLLSCLLALGGNTRWALLLVALLLPLRNIIEQVQQYPGGTQFIDMLLFSSIIGWAVNCASKHRKLFESSSLNIFAIILVLYLLISVLLGSNYLYGQMSFDVHDSRVQDWKNFCLLPLIFFIVLNNTHTKKDVWFLVGAMCLAMAVMDYYTINQVRWYSSLESRYKITATFQFLGPNEVAAFFNEYTIILMSLFFVMKRSRMKIMLGILILLNLYSLVFTYSRGAYGGLAIGMFILFALKNRKLLIPLVLVAMFWQVILPEKAIERIQGTTNQYGQLDESSQRRLNIWQQAMGLFQQNPVLGIGYGVFRNLGLDLGDTHNIYVKILTEQGVVGLLIFLLVLFCFLREGYVLYKKGEEDLDKALGLGLFICIFILIFNNFFGDRWSYMEPNAYLWIFAGLVSRLNAMARNPRPAQQHDEQEAVAAGGEETPIRVKKKIRFYDL